MHKYDETSDFIDEVSCIIIHGCRDMYLMCKIFNRCMPFWTGVSTSWIFRTLILIKIYLKAKNTKEQLKITAALNVIIKIIANISIKWEIGNKDGLELTTNSWEFTKA